MGRRKNVKERDKMLVCFKVVSHFGLHLKLLINNFFVYFVKTAKLLSFFVRRTDSVGVHLRVYVFATI